MRWDSNYSQPEVINDPAVIPAYGVTDVERAYWNAKQEALEYDRYPTLRSDKHCTSGVIHRALEDYKTSAVQLCQAFFWGQVGGLAQTKDACEGYATAASDSATAAAGYRDTAEDYKDSALASSNAAADSADDASNYASDALLSKTAAETAAGTAGTNKVDAEAWAVGTRNGVPVDSLDPAYHNNAKYYADISTDVIDDTEIAAQTTWSSSKINTELMGKADLSNGLVPAAQLPSFVDDVLMGAAQGVTETSAGTYSATGFILDGELIPCVPESGKTYVDLTTNIQFRWTGTGTNFVSMGSNLALGETSSTAYAGNKGKANADAISAIQDIIPNDASSTNKLAATSDLPTTLSQLGDDATHRVVTDTEKSTWNGKAETSDISTAIAAAFNGVTFTIVNDEVYINW